MKKILEKSGNFVTGKKWEPCQQNEVFELKLNVLECFYFQILYKTRMMEKAAEDLVCRICGVEIESDMKMVSHIKETHAGSESSDQGKIPVKLSQFSSDYNINNFFVKTMLKYTFFKRSWHY